MPDQRSLTVRRPQGPVVMVALGVVLILVAMSLVYLFTRSSDVALALSLPRGKSYRYSLNMTFDGSVTTGNESSPLRQELNETVVWRVLSVDSRGVATVSLLVEDISGELNDQPLPDIEALSTRIRVSSDGRVLTGGDLSAASGGASGIQFPGTDQITPPLPSGPVKEGDTWEKSFEQDFPLGDGFLRYTTRSRLDRYEAIQGVQAAVIDTTMQVPLDVSVDLVRVLQLVGRDPKSFGVPENSRPNVQYAGDALLRQTAWFDPGRGQLMKSVVDGRFDMNLTFRGYSEAATPPGGAARFTGTMHLEMTRIS